MITAMQAFVDQFVAPVWATPAKLIKSKGFVKTTLANKDLVSVSASHELVEMLVDPAINLMTTGPDPFEAFHKAGSVQFDQLKKPFQILSGEERKKRKRPQARVAEIARAERRG